MYCCTTIDPGSFVATAEGAQSNVPATDLTTINVEEQLAFLSKKKDWLNSKTIESPENELRTST